LLAMKGLALFLALRFAPGLHPLAHVTSLMPRESPPPCRKAEGKADLGPCEQEDGTQ